MSHQQQRAFSPTSTSHPPQPRPQQQQHHSTSSSSGLVPQPSRLSPPPGTSVSDLIAATEASAKGRKKKEDGPKRGYRACVHCRLRKARCDLGDVNSPSEPPCTRCRREQRNCVFLPSKRRRKTQTDDDQSETYPLERDEEVEDWKQPVAPTASVTRPAQQLPSSLEQYQSWNNAYEPKPFDTSLFALPPNPSAAGLPNRAHSRDPSFIQTDQTTPASIPSVPSAVSMPESSNSGHSPTARKRRREGEGARGIVTASFSNETDALEILANAATDGEKNAQSSSEEDGAASSKKVAWRDQQGATLDEFILVRQGIINAETLERLVTIFFDHHHPALPIFQTARIPRDTSQLADLCRKEPFLMATLVAVASQHHSDPGMKQVHERTWAILRDAMDQYTFNGSTTSVGFVEGVLLLAENLPRERTRQVSELLMDGDQTGLHGTENRRSWALTGLAIRAAYGLGLDQIAIEINERERTADVERARSAWTWCYLYDRTIGLRTGLAFWSRGPSLCFVGYSHISQTGETAAKNNFPYMLKHSPRNPAATNDTDSASLMQALVELTQIMTNAHDLLYPSKMRTDILVRQGEYFKFLDSFRRATDSFKTIWMQKTWTSPSLEQLCWCTYHFVRLYVSSFAFQAHVQRAQARAEAEAIASGDIKPEGKERSVQLFPRGSATSPDALFIYESIDAANEILHICLRLGQMGVLRYLPSRYLINFVYGGVFALKAGYSGATGQKEVTKTRELVDHVCAALVLACPDRDHAASRYGQMLRMLAKKLEQMDASAVPSRYASPEPILSIPSRSVSQTAPTLSSDFNWNLDQHSALSSASAGNQQSFQAVPQALQMTPMSVNQSQPFNLTSNAFQQSQLSGLSITPQSIPAMTGNMMMNNQDQSQRQTQNSFHSHGNDPQHTSTAGGYGSTAQAASNPGSNQFNFGDGPTTGDGLFDFDVDVRFDLDGFWEDFTLGEGSGFPFR